MFWAVTEVGGADFGDARVAQRLVPLGDGPSEHPTAAIPPACGSWAMPQATDRFFDNPRVTPAAVVAPLRPQTVRRVAEHAVIVAVQDTTVCNLTLHRQTRGWGPSGPAGWSGFFLPACRTVSPEGVPLGLLGGTTWVRPPEAKDSHRPHQPRPLADKDRRRGVDWRDAATTDLPPTTRGILVADREADVFDVWSHGPMSIKWTPDMET